MTVVCSVIPFDEIGCLNIKIVSGFKKEIPFNFNITSGQTTEPINLSVFTNIKFNVYTNTNVLVPALSKSLGNGVVLVDNYNAKVTFLKETENISATYYWNLELIYSTQEPPICYVQGNLEIKSRRAFLGK